MEYAPRHVLLEATRPSPLEWARRRREERDARRVAAANQRAAHRFAPLPDWHVVDLPRPMAWGHSDRQPADAGFIAIGPGGVFAVTVADHGRARVLLAGDVVQVNGRRPPYVALAKRDAARISEQMSVAAGRRIPVVPVVAFLGSGEVVYYGQPPDGCVMTTYRDLGRALNAHGSRVTETTIRKLLIVAAYVDSDTIGQYLDIRG